MDGFDVYPEQRMPMPDRLVFMMRLKSVLAEPLLGRLLRREPPDQSWGSHGVILECAEGSLIDGMDHANMAGFEHLSHGRRLRGHDCVQVHVAQASQHSGYPPRP